MIREEVLSSWKKLKEKINDLKLSDQDQQTVNYLGSCPLVGFLDNFRQSDKWDELAKIINEVLQKLDSFDPNNEIIADWWFLAIQYARTILDWIELKKINQGYREELINASRTIEEVD